MNCGLLGGLETLLIGCKSSRQIVKEEDTVIRPEKEVTSNDISHVIRSLRFNETHLSTFKNSKSHGKQVNRFKTTKEIPEGPNLTMAMPYA